MYCTRRINLIKLLTSVCPLCTISFSAHVLFNYLSPRPVVVVWLFFTSSSPSFSLVCNMQHAPCMSARQHIAHTLLTLEKHESAKKKRKKKDNKKQKSTDLRYGMKRIELVMNSIINPLNSQGCICPWVLWHGWLTHSRRRQGHRSQSQGSLNLLQPIVIVILVQVFLLLSSLLFLSSFADKSFLDSLLLIEYYSTVSSFVCSSFATPT